jgi:hypothetical protein
MCAQLASERGVRYESNQKVTSQASLSFGILGTSSFNGGRSSPLFTAFTPSILDNAIYAISNRHHGRGHVGMTAAIALRFPNRQITIAEQSRLCAEIGAIISLQTNATRILQKQLAICDLLEGTRGTVGRGTRIYNT